MSRINNSDIGYSDPEWSDYIWDPITKSFKLKYEISEGDIGTGGLGGGDTGSGSSL